MITLRERAEAEIERDPRLCAEIAKVLAARAALGLTRQQRNLFEFIKVYRAKHDLSPTYAEMADHLGVISKSNINRLVYALEERGLIKSAPNRSRSIQIMGAV